MKKKPVIQILLLLFVLFSLLNGCAGKGKDIKTIKGDPGILYRQGLERFNKRDYSEALKIFEQIKSNFPDSPPYTQWAEVKVGDCHFFKKDYVEAIAAYEEFKKTRPTHEDIPYVQYQIGMSYFSQKRTHDRDQTSTQKALSNFEYLVTNTPQSLFTDRAKEKMETCKKQLADHEFYIGNFYYKQGKYLAAASRFEGLLEKFPKRAEEDKALYLLGKSCLELDQWEKAREAFTRIVNEYPKSSHYREAKSILDQGIKGKTLIRRAKAKEPKKKAGATEGESEVVALAKFDEERRQPGLLKDDKKELRREERKVVPPSAEKPGEPAVPKEETRKVTPPLVKYEEEGRQLRAPSPLPPPKEELKVEVKPEDEKRMAPLPPPPATPETREIPKEKEGLKEEKPPKKEVEKAKEKEKKIAALPPPSKKEREVLKKETPAEPKEVKLGDTGEPIDITSDRVETFSKENLIVFRGNVVARQKDMVIYSDSLEALVFEDGKGIEKVVAGGNVKIQQGLRVANCQKAVFYNRDQRVVLTGDPKVWEGDNLVSGEEIIFDIAKNRIEVKGGPGGRGKVRILPGGEFEKLIK